MLVRKKITLYGIVQGVGFRPFIHRLVKKYKLCGWICNSNQGVEMEVEGEKSAYQDFLKDLKNHPPSLALIVDIKIKNLPIAGYSEFFIKESNSQYQHPIILIPPDISICEDCLRELNNPLDRRYHYPFINCTNCGPRFTIIKDMPYDRKQTTMQEFPMCADCAQEFHDLENRRYHAEPNACPVCGPQVSLYIKNKKIDTPEPIPEVRERLQKGEIGIIKGLGGFHLACDARNEEAVLRVRAIKKRDKKPFALMAENISTIKNYCFVSALASRYLESREKPILLLKKKRICRLSPDIAPGNAYLGFMLPYTPLHFLLMQKSGLILVMTSANFSEEPIIIEDKKA
ncbi:MAG TPA: Sua5/YciO/YrdC/YwlC family protein, partial [Atribacterota bacterium]|nr:Sua5/YciO/YrdC/YwlC family protein [Atribacterota bacterium]